MMLHMFGCLGKITSTVFGLRWIRVSEIQIVSDNVASFFHVTTGSTICTHSQFILSGTNFMGSAPYCFGNYFFFPPGTNMNFIDVNREWLVQVMKIEILLKDHLMNLTIQAPIYRNHQSWRMMMR